ncbi:hypothetical protein Dimus_035831, partial [Dionaea muscipula]
MGDQRNWSSAIECPRAFDQLALGYPKQLISQPITNDGVVDRRLSQRPRMIWRVQRARRRSDALATATQERAKRQRIRGSAAASGSTSAASIHAMTTGESASSAQRRHVYRASNDGHNSDVCADSNERARSDDRASMAQQQCDNPSR